MTARRSSAKGLLRVLRTGDSGFEGEFEKLVQRRDASDDGAAGKIVKRCVLRTHQAITRLL